MSAAATAAGYLYASGRLRGRGNKDEPARDKEAKREAQPQDAERAARRPIRVAALPEREQERPAAQPKRTPTVQYRTRRWRPDAS